VPSARTKVLLLLSAVALVAIYVTAVLLSTTSDRVDQLDSEVMEDAAGPACITLRTELDAMPLLDPLASKEQRATRVAEQAAVVQRFLAQVRAVGDAAIDDDEPAREWLGDWEALLRARQQAAASDFTAAFEVPRDGERAITERMNAIGVSACRVPTGLTTAP
jgi:hypothetical protein